MKIKLKIFVKTNLHTACFFYGIIIYSMGMYYTRIIISNDTERVKIVFMTIIFKIRSQKFPVERNDLARAVS